MHAGAEDGAGRTVPGPPGAPAGKGRVFGAGTVRFLSLKWKITLALSLVLLEVTAGLAILGRMHMEGRYENDSQARWRQQTRELNALMLHRYDELQHIAALSTLTHVGRESLEGHLQATLEEYAASSAPAWPLEAAALYAADGSESFSWHENSAGLASLARAASAGDQPLNTVLCLPTCRQYSAVPLLSQHQRRGVLVLGRSLADVLQDFRQLSGVDAALLLPEAQGTPANGSLRPVPEWSSSLSMATNVEQSYRLVQAAAAAHPFGPLRQNSVRVTLDAYDYELSTMPLRLGERGGEAQVIFIRDVTVELQELQQAWRQSLTLGLAGALAAELLLLALLWRPVRRLRLLAETLPLLARGGYEVLRRRLTGQRFRLYRDELDLLSETAQELSLELERLTGEVNLRAEELEASNQSLMAVNQELETRQHELRQAQDKLVQAESVAALGRIAAGMAHEINNALNYTIGALPALERVLDQLAPEKAESTAASLNASTRRKADLLLNNMRTGVQRIAAIVQDLTDFARPRHGKWRTVDLTREIETCLALVEPSCQERITMTRRLSPLPPISCHPGQIGQLLLNLLTNAVEAIEGRGLIAIAAWSSADRIHLRVSDSGRGIPAAQLGKIFDPSFSTKGRGSGMGLAICHSIVRQHGGEIKVTSSEDQGATFEVILPLEQPAEG
ncbi:MAG: hypothetical protein BWK76_16955 [Desulfobulbaceae bacterium A2]|nr:MAG: hypothetical protein BWK76_16955 [Desulfobulbaceae bacterium A2]